MAMGIQDANDVQTLIRHTYGLANITGETPTADQVAQAAERLADRSQRVLMAGLSSRDLAHRSVLP